MNKLRYLLLLFPLLLCGACEKDTEPEAARIEIKLEEPTNWGRTSITLNGSVSDPSSIKEAGFIWWKTGEKEQATEVPCKEALSTNIDVIVDGLEVGGSYLYCMYVGNGVNRKLSNTHSFTTPTVGSPLVTQTLVKDENNLTVSATVADDGIDDNGRHIVASGFCWNTIGRPTVFDSKLLMKNDLKDLNATLTGLKGNTDYYIRAFAQNDSSYLAYGPELKIRTKNKDIRTPEDLLAFRNAVNNKEDLSAWTDENGVVNLEADLDLLAISAWEPITECYFIFDGNNHTLSNVRYALPDANQNSRGLFTSIKPAGIVRNLTIGKGSQAINEHCTVYSLFGSIAGVNEGIIENCTSYCTIRFHELDSAINTFAGGIVSINSGEIRNCTNYGNVTASWGVGGIAHWNYGTISKCTNYGNIQKYGNENYGGDFANGISENGENAILTDCINFGQISGGALWISGVGGNYGTMADCVNNGEVTGYHHVAGVASGIYNGTVSNCTNNGIVEALYSDWFSQAKVGGIVATLGWYETYPEASAINCTNTGKINGNKEYTGNIVGFMYPNGNFTGCTYGGFVNGTAGTQNNAVGFILQEKLLKSNVGKRRKQSDQKSFTPFPGR